MAISKIFAIDLSQLTFVMIAYALTIEDCNLTSAAISQFIALEYLVSHIPGVASIFAKGTSFMCSSLVGFAVEEFEVVVFP